MLLSLSAPFIKRPVLTTVCTLLILLIGGIAIPLLPIAKLPQIAPTEVQITSVYTGADAKTTTDTVTTVIERQVNGVENMRYMYSNTNNSGISQISVSFPTDVDRNEAQVNVQNLVSQAEPQLPDVVKQIGVTVEKSAPNILLVYALTSERDANGKDRYDTVFISNYIDLFILDEIKRIYGVGSVTIFGERKYAMRIWLDPNAMAARGLTTNDVVNTIREQNIQVGAGTIGQSPSPEDQQFEIALRAIGRFATAEEAENLVVQVGDDGTLVRIKDIGRAELGAESYSIDSVFNEYPAVGIGVYQLPGTNALDTANAIKAKIAELKASFPPGLNIDVAFDTTLFVNAAISEAVLALFQAVVLVVLIIFIFLQDWRTTIIPAIAIPVSLIGAMSALLAFGFELNQLTLFAAVLASGLVVDDGIVIVEAIASKIEQGMRPLQASLDAMEELVGAVISTSVVLMAVFIPVSFFPGTTGIVYKQFALTIAFAIAFSTFNALTFSPTMSALLLRPRGETRGPLKWIFEKFNAGFNAIANQYNRLILFLTGSVKALVMLLFVAGLVCTYLIYQAVPSGFIPEEDQGYFLIVGQAPAGVALNFTKVQTEKVMRIAADYPEVDSVYGVSGFGFDGQNSNQIITFVLLKPWDERPGEDKSVFGIVNKINQRLREEITDAQVLAVNAPPVDGLSNFGGVEMQLQNRRQLPMENLIENTQNFLAEANNQEKWPQLAGVFTQYTFNTPQIAISVDRNQAKALNVNINDIFGTLQTYLGSNYVNDFVLGERQYRVYVQAESDYRSNPANIESLYVRSQDGSVVQLSNLVNLETANYPPIVSHYNIYPSIKILALPAPGYSSGQAIAAMDAIATEVLQPGFTHEWTGTAFEELSSGGSAPIIFGLGFVMVFLVLAAQYESYIDPTIIMLTVPLAMLGALSGIWFRANFMQAGSAWPVLSNNIYCQVGLVMLIGMASKNTILIVEFANQARALGMDITQAAIQGAKQRFRPILMTTASTLFGFIPLLAASGAGAISRWTLGTAVFSGMALSTILTLGLAPTLYIVIKSFEKRFLNGGDGPSQPQSSAPRRQKPETPPAQPEEVSQSLKTAEE